MVTRRREQHPYRQGGEFKPDARHGSLDERDAKDNASWKKGEKGQGRDGRSHGYGGSAGDGTGPSGPEEKK